jgi:hypothetical protein
MYLSHFVEEKKCQVLKVLGQKDGDKGQFGSL